MNVKRAVSRALVPGLMVAAVLGASLLVRPSSLASSVVSVCSGYLGAPAVTGVAPTSGTASGGTSVTITGCGFTGVTGVQFGGAAAAGFTPVNDSSVTATAPPHAVATVDVQVTTPSGTSATSANDKYTFTQPGCASAGLSSDKASPQLPGAVITFTATSTGCANPEYKFWLQSPGGAWTQVQNYDGPTWVWNTTGFARGNYVVNVWVTQIGSGVAVQANQLMSYTLGPGSACTASGLTSDKASPQQIDFTITFTATSSGCTAPEYLFYLQSPSGAWSIERSYGGPTWAWHTTGLASIGLYHVNVWVRAAGSGVAVQSNTIVPFTISDRVCTSAGLTANKTSPQAHGVVITFTATSAACARPEYLFYLKGPGVNGTWSIAQGYDGNQWAWSTAGVASIGTYEVNVWVKAVGSPSSVQTNFVMFYTLT